MEKVPGDLMSRVDTMDVQGESSEAGEMSRIHVRQQGAGPIRLDGSGREKAHDHFT